MLNRLFRPANSMPPTEGRIFKLRIVTCLLASVVHLSLIPAYLAVHDVTLISLNAAATALNLVSLWLISSGRPLLGLWLTCLEVTFHVAFASTLLGTRSGYPLILLVPAQLAFVVFTDRQRLHRWAASSLAILVGLVLLFVGDEAGSHPLPYTIASVLLPANVAVTVSVLVSIAAYGANVSSRAERDLDEARRRADDLLLEILPPSIAERLKKERVAIAERADSVTVLFADLVGFTKLASTVQPTELVGMLNDLFSQFDALAKKHGLEKIKTIGDAYMAVAGLPDPHPDHVAAVAAMALEMLEVVKGTELSVRIGIHTGPVVAGVIGTRKYSYDVWGDTVNTASRLESHGQPGRVHVSDAVVAALGDRFRFEPRGEIELKGKGGMKTAWLVARA